MCFEFHSFSLWLTETKRKEQLRKDLLEQIASDPERVVDLIIYLIDCVEKLEDLPNKNSGNSSKPPSTDKGGAHKSKNRSLRGMSSNQFVRSHMDTTCVADFLTAEVWTMSGLVRYQVLFVMNLAKQHVQIVQISCKLNSEVMAQVARVLTDPKTVSRRYGRLCLRP